MFAGPYYNNAAPREIPTLVANVFATLFLPGLLLGIISRWHKDIFKTFVAHPSMVLMPAFTGYAFQKEKEKETEEPFIVFSPKFTLLNILFSILVLVVHWPHGLASLIPQIPGLLLTLLSLPLISRQPCYRCPPLNWCCACFSLPQVEHGALLPSQPLTSFVINTEGRLEKEEEEEEEVDTIKVEEGEREGDIEEESEELEMAN